MNQPRAHSSRSDAPPGARLSAPDQWATWLIDTYGVVAADGTVTVKLSQDAAAERYGRSPGTIAGYVRRLSDDGWLVGSRPLRFCAVTRPNSPVVAADVDTTSPDMGRPRPARADVDDRSFELVAELLRRHAEEPAVVAALADVVAALGAADRSRGSAESAVIDVRGSSDRTDRTDRFEAAASSSGLSSPVRGPSADRSGPAEPAAPIRGTGEDPRIGGWISQIIDVAVQAGANPHYPAGLFQRLVDRFDGDRVAAAVDRVVGQVAEGTVHSPFRVLAAAADDPARTVEYFRVPDVAGTGAGERADGAPGAGTSSTLSMPVEPAWVEVVDDDGNVRLARNL